MFSSVFGATIIKRAVEAKAVELRTHDIRAHAEGAHRTVDDAPYGGGAGMVMKPDVLCRALENVEQAGKKREVIFLSAQGEKLTHKLAEDLSKLDQLVLVCGRYEGVDERFLESCVDREISVGDYVTSGGEIPAMIVCDAVIRLLPKVLGNVDSIKNESHANGLLEHPQYTRPFEFRGMKVPEVLMKGNHSEIEKWRHERSIERTLKRRPDMLIKK